eukprot:7287664-Pyramimonas_sp.AAC.1
MQAACVRKLEATLQDADAEYVRTVWESAGAGAKGVVESETTEAPAVKVPLAEMVDGSRNVACLTDFEGFFKVGDELELAP